MQAGEAFESVLDAARCGAEWAWSRLVDDIDGTLRGYVRRQGGIDPDDLVGETWLHVARGIHRFEGDHNAFRSWVFMVAHHRIIDERRRQRRRPEELLERELLDREGPPAGSAESYAMERIEHEELQQLLDLLSSDQREVVLLRFVGGFGISEIAEIVGKKAGAVQALQRRALARLKRILEEGVRNPGDVAVTRVHEAFEAIS
jgi:RNA polymerase sigma-70 factor (ECF subfamily)